MHLSLKVPAAALALATAFLFAAATPAGAQVTEQWAARYGGPGDGDDFAAATAVDAAGNVVVTGSSLNGDGNMDYYTAKYAAGTGALLWEVRYDGPGHGDDWAFSMAMDSAGDVAVTGYSVGASAINDAYTVKYAGTDGHVVWEKRYAGEAGAFGVAMDNTGNVAITGYRWNGTTYDYYTAKYAAADGALLWEQSFNGPGDGNDVSYSVAVDGAGNVAVTGYSANDDGDSDVYTAKYATVGGALLWEQRHDGADNLEDAGASVAMDTAGNVVVTGYSASTAGGEDAYTAKYTAAGTILWEAVYDGANHDSDRGRAVAMDGAGDVAVTGYTTNGTGGLDMYTAKYATATGALLWEQTYGPVLGVHEGNGIAMDGAGNVVVTGTSQNATDLDFYTVKYGAAAGAVEWEQRYDGPAHGDDVMNMITPFAQKIALTPDGGAVVAGCSTNGTNLDYATVRYGAADTITGAPTLTAPATAAVTGSPVSVAFTLPEGALAGSVKLTFAGTVTTELTLANTEGTAGAHAFSFAPGEPTASAEIASGSAVPDGTYTVTLSYQDALGNPAASASSAAVLLDTVGPAGGTMLLAPSSPVDASAALTVSFADWTDPSGPLTYAVLIDDVIVSPLGPTASRNITAPATAGAHTLKGRIVDALGSVTEVTQPFTVNTPQESWRQLHFGTTANTGSAADTADPDGDGANNLFEWVAGLAPNDPASRFLIRVEEVIGQPGQKAIIFSPVLAGRTYEVQGKATFTDPWAPLTSFTTSDNVPLQERTVIDLGAGTGAKFYHVEIVLPE